MSISFSELRQTLNDFNTRENNLLTIRELHVELQKLKKLRHEYFYPDLDVPKQPEYASVVIDRVPAVVNQTEYIKIDVVECPIEESVYKNARASTDTNPASVTYNAERYIPYRILWAKVIIRATYDYALWKESPDSRLRKFAQDAERWLFESSDLDLSFENICFAFDFPVEKIRQKTRTLTKQDVKKLEFRERQGRSDILDDSIGGNIK